MERKGIKSKKYLFEKKDMHLSSQQWQYEAQSLPSLQRLHKLPQQQYTNLARQDWSHTMSQNQLHQMQLDGCSKFNDSNLLQHQISMPEQYNSYSKYPSYPPIPDQDQDEKAVEFQFQKVRHKQRSRRQQLPIEQQQTPWNQPQYSHSSLEQQPVPRDFSQQYVLPIQQQQTSWNQPQYSHSLLEQQPVPRDFSQQYVLPIQQQQTPWNQPQYSHSSLEQQPVTQDFSQQYVPPRQQQQTPWNQPQYSHSSLEQQPVTRDFSQQYVLPIQQQQTPWNQPQYSHSSLEQQPVTRDFSQQYVPPRQQQTAINQPQYSHSSLEQQPVSLDFSQQYVPSRQQQQTEWNQGQFSEYSQNLLEQQQQKTRDQRQGNRNQQQRQYSQHQAMSHNSSQQQQEIQYRSEQPQRVQQYSQQRTRTSQYQEQQVPGPSRQQQTEQNQGQFSEYSQNLLEQQQKTRDRQQGNRNQQQRQYSQHQAMSYNSSQQQQKIRYQSGQPQRVQQYSQQRTRTSQYQEQVPAETDGIIPILTNMFEIIIGENFATSVVHYDVIIEPKSSKAIYTKVFEECRDKHFEKNYPAFDGMKNAYSATELPNVHETEIEIQVKVCDNQCGDKRCKTECTTSTRNKTFRITLQKVGKIDFSWLKNLSVKVDDIQSSIQALDVIIRYRPKSKFINVGKLLFRDLDNGTLLDKKKPHYLTLSWGLFLSAILGYRMYLNVDVVPKGFVKAEKVNCLINQLEEYEMSNKKKLEEKLNFLKNLRVIYKVLPNKNSQELKKLLIYRIQGINLPANKQTFKYNGIEVTVKDFFKEQKNYILKFPHLPCLVAKKTKGDNKEEPTEIYLPAELCTIVKGQSVKKLNSDQTTNMIKAMMDPKTRKERIEKAFEMINVNVSPTMKEFHLSVNTQMKQVNARILPAPKLLYNKSVEVNNGMWTMGRYNKFNQAATSLEKHTWTILNLQSKSTNDQIFDSMKRFMENLQTYASKYGMQIQNADNRKFKSLEKKREIQKYFQDNKNMKLIIVVIPDYLSDFTDIYSEIKQMTELDIGVLTQCLKIQTFEKVVNLNPSIITNILLKINAKLNGINHILEESSKYLKKNCMIVGADVTHPPPDVNTPSIAAVTASSDTFGFQYNVMYKLQNSKEEIISGLEDIITSQLSIYKKKTNCFPNSIIYYRDGISDGQFSQFKDIEITAIKNACKKFNQLIPKIPITCLIVQKRHHVRFFPINEHKDRNGNVKVGTIVDTEIISHNEDNIDFYLISHMSIQGTVRPTKYRCIINESKYSSDEIEKLTYYLCHMYTRCTRAVSYPTPTYYAHLAAYRAKTLLDGCSTTVYSDDLSAAQRKLDSILINNQYPMYFV